MLFVQSSLTRQGFHVGAFRALKRTAKVTSSLRDGLRTSFDFCKMSNEEAAASLSRSQMTDTEVSIKTIGDPDAEQQQQGRGLLVVVSSPSGGGKGTLVRAVLQSVANLQPSVSWTTRRPRRGEVENRDYHFVTIAEFIQMRERGEFLEWAEVHGNLYGTALTEVERRRGEGVDIILEIDVQGAQAVRTIVGREVVSVFILPPSFEVLRKRLAGRSSETPVDQALRLRNARAEVERYKEFDYIIENDDATRASVQLAGIIYAERARRARQTLLVERVLATFPVD